MSVPTERAPRALIASSAFILATAAAARFNARCLGTAVLWATLGSGLVAGGPALAKTAPPKPVLDGSAVAVPDRYGADTAQQIFAAGGNAVDAAVAIAFTLAVTDPDAGNLGGGGFMTVFMDGKPYFLDYRERAPQQATRDMYLDDKGVPVPGLSAVGHRAVGVPGTVDGLWQAQQRFGKLKWKQVLAPAIRYATEGFQVEPRLQQRHDAALKNFAGKTNFDAYFSNLKAGLTFRQPELAQTLSRIAGDGGREFYEGRTAGLIAQQMYGHGIVTRQDLAQYKAVWREPLTAEWSGYRIVTAPPPSSGGVSLIQMLKMKADLKPAFDGLELNSAPYIHLVAQIEDRVFADRQHYLGDPDSNKVPVGRLIDDAYLAQRAGEIKSDEAPVAPGLGAASGAGSRAPADAQNKAGSGAASGAASGTSGAASGAVDSKDKAAGGAASGAASGVASGTASSAAPNAASGVASGTVPSAASGVASGAAPSAASGVASGTTPSTASGMAAGAASGTTPSAASGAAPDATPSTDAQAPARAASDAAPPAADNAPARDPMPEKAQTTHFSVVDKWGNAVSNTYTLDGSFGSGVVVDGAGFLLNDAMDDFVTRPGAAGQSGMNGAGGAGGASDVSGTDANLVAPGRRPLSSMTPTIVLKDDKVALVIGTPGGSRIFTSIFQVMTNLVDFGMTPTDALAAMRFHHQLLPPKTIYWEPYRPIAGELAGQLKAKGYTLQGQSFNGDVQLIRVDGRTPVPAADPRGVGVARMIPAAAGQ